jgi:hypothetical protein
MPTEMLGRARDVRHAAAMNHRCEAIIRISHNLANAISFTLTITIFMRTSVCSRRIGELYLIVYACLSKPVTFYGQQIYNCSAPLLAFPSTILQRNTVPMNNTCSHITPPNVSPAADLAVSNSKITNSSADDKVEEVSMATDALSLRTSKRKVDFSKSSRSLSR